jgi:hypothetical protein
MPTLPGNKEWAFLYQPKRIALLVGAPYRLPVVAVKSLSQISRSLLIIYLILIGLVGFNDRIMSSF